MTQEMIIQSTGKLRVSRPSHAGEAQIIPPGITMGEIVNRYFQCKDSAAGSEHSRRAYYSEINRLMKFIGEDAPVEGLNRFSAHSFSVALYNSGLAPRSRNRALAYARDLIRWAFRAGIYPDDFGHTLKSSRVPRTMPTVPTTKEMEAMLDGPCPTSWPERDRCTVELLYCNLRVCEVVALNLEDMAADEFPLRGKGRRERKAFLTPSARDALSQYLPSRAALLRKRGVETHALFVNLRNGQRITVKSVHRIVKAIAYAKGLPKYISPVKLRGACATHMLDGGAPLSAVSQLLGHEKLTTTMH
ncbi:MAG: tyrosine-type recombinase/integrase [Steroidobacteraceae bacterium]